MVGLSHLIRLHPQPMLFRLQVLWTLKGRIPPNPLWAEIVWQRQENLRSQPEIAGLSRSR